MALSVNRTASQTQQRITAAIAVGSELESVLSSVVRAAARLCHAPMAMIALLTDRPGELEVVGTFGIRAPLRGVRLPVALSLNGLDWNRRSVRSTDVLGDRRPVLRRIPQMTGARGALAVPLRGREGVFGTLGVAKRIPWDFTDRDAMLLRQLADSASIAIQNAQLREQLRGPPFPSTAPDGEASRAVRRAQSIAQSVAVGRRPTPTAGCHLSPREREIITLVAGGKTFKEIGSILGISGRTVEHYLERVKARFHQPRLVALVGYVLTRGGVQPVR